MLKIEYFFKLYKFSYTIIERVGDIMCSKGHIATGAITSATAAIMVTKSPDMITNISNVMLCILSSLITSQLADIDTPNSSISKAFPIMKIITNKIVLVIEFCAICFYLCALQIAGAYATINEYKYLLLLSAFWGLQIWLRVNLQHRGFTHTILFNSLLSGLILYPYFTQGQNTYYLFFAVGSISGLVSHLIFDTMTIQGCPLFAPFYKKNIKWLKRFKIRSGKDDIYGILFSIIILCFVLFTKIQKYY